MEPHCSSDSPFVRTSKKTIVLHRMQGLFNYFWKGHSICRIAALLACCVWRVLFQAQDEWHYLLYSYYRALPLWRRGHGVLSFIMLDMRLLLFFLSNTFSPRGTSQGTSLYWTSLFIYFALCEQASLEACLPCKGTTVLEQEKSSELPVTLNIVWG